MRRPVWRLVLASVLFAGWLGYLAYLVSTASRPVVLSRSQFLVTDLAVKARIENPGSNKAVVEEVYWARDGIKPPATGKTIDVANLTECEEPRYVKTGFCKYALEYPKVGAGECILPLRQKDGGYEVARIPSTPGYPPGGGEGAARVYPDTTETRRQLERLKPQ